MSLVSSFHSNTFCANFFTNLIDYNISDTCVILDRNITIESDIMESFRLANEAVLDKLSPPLRLAINQTDIYKEGDSYDSTSRL